MLVLSRQAGDRVRIGADITVTILETTGSTVRVGVEAPDTVMIMREELLEKADELIRQEGE